MEMGYKLGVDDNPAQHDPAYYEDPTMGLFLDAAERVGDFADQPDDETGASQVTTVSDFNGESEKSVH
jgi:hypothetical protein